MEDSSRLIEIHDRERPLYRLDDIRRLAVTRMGILFSIIHLSTTQQAWIKGLVGLEQNTFDALLILI